MSEDLDSQLQDKLKSTGSLSSADLAAAVSDQPLQSEIEQVEGDVTEQIPVDNFDDPLTSDQSLMAATSDLSGEMVDVTTTEAERNHFLDTVITGGRFTLPFSIFGGRVTGVIRSRTQTETRAIWAQLMREMREGDIQVNAEYTVRIRSMLMGAQLESYNDVKIPEFPTPLEWVRGADGQDTPPAWLEAIKSWEDLDDGLATAIYEEIINFERKYWTLVRHADDQDFWQPVTSTSEPQ